MALGACKIHFGCNVFQVPIQIIPLGIPKRGSHPLRIKIAMTYLRIFLQNEYQTVGNSPLALLQPDVKPTQPALNISGVDEENIYFIFQFTHIRCKTFIFLYKRNIDMFIFTADQKIFPLFLIQLITDNPIQLKALLTYTTYGIALHLQIKIFKTYVYLNYEKGRIYNE